MPAPHVDDFPPFSPDGDDEADDEQVESIPRVERRRAFRSKLRQIPKLLPEDRNLSIHRVIGVDISAPALKDAAENTRPTAFDLVDPHTLDATSYNER